MSVAAVGYETSRRRTRRLKKASKTLAVVSSYTPSIWIGLSFNELDRRLGVEVSGNSRRRKLLLKLSFK